MPSNNTISSQDSEPSTPIMTQKNHTVSSASLPPVKKRFGWIWLVLGVLLLVLLNSISLLAVLWLHQQWERQQQTRFAELSQSIQSVQAMAAQWQQQAADFSEQLTTLHQQVRQQHDFVGSLQQKVFQLYAPTQMKLDIQQLSEIEFELNVAQHYLQSGITNLPQSQQWLNAAQQRLATMQTPVIAPVKKALDTLQQQLQALSATNMVNVSQQLSRLLATVAQLDTEEVSTKVTSAYQHPSAWSENRNTHSWYQQAWYQFIDYLKQLVTIHHHQQPVHFTLKQQQFAYAELRMALLQAQWSVLAQNQEAYQASLNRASILLQRYIPKQLLRARVFEQLQRLSTINLNPPLPSFTAVFAALHQALGTLQQQVNSSVSSQSVPKNQRNAPKAETMSPVTRALRPPLLLPARPSSGKVVPKPIIPPAVEI